jgi:non-specific serine/threonine protein kinase
LSEGRDWFEKALAKAPVRTAVRAKALYHAAYLAYIQGDLLVSSAQLTESVATWRKLGGRQGLARALWLLGLVMLVRGEPAVARSYAEESVEISRTIEEDDFGLSMALAITGIIVLNQRDSALASSLLEESAAISREAGDDWALSLPLRYLGAAAFRRGDYDRAVLLFKESLTVLRESLEKWYVSRSLECLATVVAIQRNYERAARLFGAGEALRKAIGASQVPFYLVAYHHGVAVARAGLDEMVFERAWAEGLAMSTEEALAEALEERG